MRVRHSIWATNRRGRNGGGGENEGISSFSFSSVTVGWGSNGAEAEGASTGLGGGGGGAVLTGTMGPRGCDTGRVEVTTPEGMRPVKEHGSEEVEPREKEAGIEVGPRPGPWVVVGSVGKEVGETCFPTWTAGGGTVGTVDVPGSVAVVVVLGRLVVGLLAVRVVVVVGGG